MIETTAGDFQFFKDAVKHYCDRLKISGWDMRFRHDLVEDGFACTRTDCDNRVVEFRLTTHWRDDVWVLDDERLDYCARHEAGHLFQRRVFALAEARYVTELELDTLDEEMAIRIAELLDE